MERLTAVKTRFKIYRRPCWFFHAWDEWRYYEDPQYPQYMIGHYYRNCRKCGAVQSVAVQSVAVQSVAVQSGAVQSARKNS